MCYYHSGSKFEYWKITEANKGVFANHHKFDSCPFKGGLNQLWRNQLLGFALKKQNRYKEVYFSVVHHPENDALNESIEQYKVLIKKNPEFSVFTSKDVINIVSKLSNKELDIWVEWYQGLYKIEIRNLITHK